MKSKLEKTLKKYKKRISYAKEKILDSAFYSIVGSALFLQNLIFYDIATRGGFYATEPNPYILGAEIGITTLGDYLYVRSFLKFLKK